MPLEPSDLDLLKRELQQKYVPLLPPLLDQTKPDHEKEKKNLSRALSAFALHKLCGVSEDIAAKSVVDDFDDCGIDAILRHGDVLYLLQTKLKESEQFQQADALTFCAGIKKILSLDLASFNAHLLNRKAEVEDAVENCSVIQTVVAHVGSGISEHAKTSLLNFLSSDPPEDERLQSSYEDMDCQKIAQYLKGSNAYPPVDATLWLEGYKASSEPKNSYFGLVDVESLVALHKQHEKGLYEKNIRTFLGMGLKHRVNESIQETLKTQPENFCYLNNGVTALCQVIEPKNSRGGKKQLKLRGLSVINGAQTIASSAHAGASGADLSKAKVMLTIIKADADSDFGKLVTKARNHQNPVSLSDFVALEEDQERLRRAAAILGIHYDYKRGTLLDGLDPTRIHVEEAVQALAIFHDDPRYAIWLKKEPDNLFQPQSSQYKGLFPATLTVHRLINAVYVNRCIQNQVWEQVGATIGQERLVYKHGAFGLSWILAKQFSEQASKAILLNEADIKTALSKPFDDVRQILWDTIQPELANHGPLKLFRNQSHAIPLLRNVMLKGFGIAATDPAIVAKQMQTSPEGYPKPLFDYMVQRAPQIKVGT